MNLEALKKQLIIDEGCKYEVYLDHLGNPTFGIGHLLTKKDIEWHAFETNGKRPGMKISKERVEEVFKKDIDLVISDCQKVFEKFNEFAEEVQQIIANMMFNMGLTRFKGFSQFIAAIKSKNYKKAAKEMIDSKWYRDFEEVKSKRAKRLVSRMDKFANDTLCNV